MNLTSLREFDKIVVMNDSFILKIPQIRELRSLPREGKPFSVLFRINDELRRIPDSKLMDDTSGMKLLTIGQNHGIREKNVSKESREEFKSAMPEIIEMFPGMVNPFMGHIELHSIDGVLKEVHFSPKH